MAGCRIPPKERFGFKHWAPQKHTQGRWVQGNDYVSVWYLLYKTLVLCYFLAFYTWYHVTNSNELGSSAWKYWIYLTNWGYELLVLKLILEFVLVAARFSSENWYGQEKEQPFGSKPFLHKSNYFGNQLLWFMTSTSHTLAVSITVAYWTCLYPFEGPKNNTKDNFININQHAVQGVVCVLDTFVSAHPKRLAHVWAPALVGITYLAFNIVYILAGGTDPSGHHWIYSITDWLNSPGIATGVAIGILIMLFVIHCALWGLVKARDKLYLKKFKVPTESESTQARTTTTGNNNYGAFEI